MKAIEFSEKLLGMEQSLLNYAYHLKLDYADSKDLVQETFLKAILNRDKFVDSGLLKAWTFTIMRNTFINNYRHTTLQNTICERRDDSLPMKRRSSDADNPDSIFSVLEINLRIDKLDENFKVPFKMYIAGFRYREIAEKININIGTVKSRIFLARKVLMSQLKS